VTYSPYRAKEYGVCKKKYSSGDELEVSLAGGYGHTVTMDWFDGERKGNSFYFSYFWTFNRKEKSATITNFPEREEEHVYLHAAEFDEEFGKLNPFDHLFDKVLTALTSGRPLGSGRPLDKKKCEEIFNYIENNPPNGYAKDEWISRFVQANKDAFLAKAATAKPWRGYLES
ncbi:hypothetical protein FOZ62_003031, partial [Perkinsus olseni]